MNRKVRHALVHSLCRALEEDLHTIADAFEGDGFTARAALAYLCDPKKADPTTKRALRQMKRYMTALALPCWRHGSFV